MNTEYHWNSSSYEPHVEVASELKEIGFKIVLIYSLEVAKNEFECEQDSFKDEEQFYIKKTFELIDKIINNNSFSDEDKTNLENCSFFVKDLFKNLTTSSSFDWFIILLDYIFELINLRINNEHEYELKNLYESCFIVASFVINNCYLEDVKEEYNILLQKLFLVGNSLHELNSENAPINELIKYSFINIIVRMPEIKNDYQKIYFLIKDFIKNKNVAIHA
jgi:hypothetical protein